MSQVKSKYIADSAITTAKIANSAVDLTTKVTGVLPSSRVGLLRTENAQTGTTYTLALADGNSAGGNPFVTLSNAATILVTVPPNSSVAFPVGTEVSLTQGGAGAVIVLPGSGVSINALSDNSQLLAQYAQATLRKTGTDTWVLFGELTHPTYIAATGGTITTDGNFKVHTFTSSGTFQITSGLGSVQYLVAAGGGGGGYSTTNTGGGGGAGGLLTGTLFRSAGSYTVTIGAGGAGGSIVDAAAPSGSNSVFDTLTATGGGGGANGSANGANGGSGGGASQQVTTGGLGTVGQGNNGGSTPSGSNINGAGGGGAGAVGVDGNVQPNGGIGISSSITGTPTYYSGGGGGGSYQTTAGSGGLGGGGAGAQTDGNGTAGTANSGGGGGGASYGTGGGPYNGAAGGSGVVIVRYRFQ